jgi:membrane-associated phospholipid phosphatase
MEPSEIHWETLPGNLNVSRSLIPAGDPKASVKPESMLIPAVFIANCVNPILTVLLAAAPIIGMRKSICWEFWGRSALVWPEHPSFPSGHETFGLCAATSLVFWDRRWLVIVLPLTILLAWALVAAHFHRPIDVAGALLVGPPCAVLFQWKRNARKAR